MPTSGTTERRTPSEPRPRRAVLLVHRLPDGSSHLDWMLERRAPQPDAPSPAHRLRSFRAVVRLDAPPHVEFLADPLPDHRDAYLTREGPVSGGRGDVRRLARGHLIELAENEAVIAWDEGESGAARRATVVRYRFASGPGRFVLVRPEPVESPQSRGVGP